MFTQDKTKYILAKASTYYGLTVHKYKYRCEGLKKRCYRLTKKKVLRIVAQNGDSITFKVR